MGFDDFNILHCLWICWGYTVFWKTVHDSNNEKRISKDEVTDMMNADWGFRLTNALKRAYANILMQNQLWFALKNS